MNKRDRKSRAYRRKDLGIYVRSRWEANYGRYLNFVRRKWFYEPKTFWFENIKRGTRSYTPDFYLPKYDEYIEVKGYLDQKSKTRIKRMKKYYPKIKVTLVTGEFFKKIVKEGWCRLIPHWECGRCKKCKKSVFLALGNTQI